MSKALQIVLCETNNAVLENNAILKQDINMFKIIIRQLSNKESLLSKIMEYSEYENSYNLHEVILDDEFLITKCNSLYSYDDLKKLIPQLQYLGFHIVDLNGINFEYLYLDWKKELCPMEKQIALKYNRTIYLPKYASCFI